MVETEPVQCVLCQELVSPDTFSATLEDFRVGREVRLVQGDRRLQGMTGTIKRLDNLYNPGIYRVDVEGVGECLVRWDMMMFSDRIQSNPHYRALYNKRLDAMKYEYPPLVL